MINITNTNEYAEYLSIGKKQRSSYFNDFVFPLIKSKSKEVKEEYCYTDLAGKVKFYPKSNKILFCKECRWEDDGLDHFLQFISI